MPLSTRLMDVYLSESGIFNSISFLTGRENMDEIITVWLPVLEGPHEIAEMEVEIRPAYDNAFGWPYYASDVCFIDSKGKRHAFETEERRREIIDRIHDDLPRDTWKEIEEAAEAR